MKCFLILMIALLPVLSKAQDLVSVQDVQATLSKAKPYTIVFFVKGTKEVAADDANAQALQMQHLQYLFTLKEKNYVSVFGPVTDNSTIRGILIFNLTDQAQVRKLMDADPHVKSGHLAYEIHPWFGVPGQVLGN